MGAFLNQEVDHVDQSTQRKIDFDTLRQGLSFALRLTLLLTSRQVHHVQFPNPKALIPLLISDTAFYDDGKDAVTSRGVVVHRGGPHLAVAFPKLQFLQQIIHALHGEFL